jgi:hypothetical protein
MCSYIDDIIVKSKFQGELIAILRKLLIACRIIINPNKIFSGVSLISYILGEHPTIKCLSNKLLVITIAYL